MNKFDDEVFRVDNALRELNQELADRVEAAKEAIRKEMDDRYEEIYRQRREVFAMHSAEQKLIDDANISSVLTDNRIGQVFVEWKTRSWGRSTYATGKRGLCEPYTREHDRLRKIGYGSSRCGDLVMRHLKKDGTKSKVWESFGMSLSDGPAPLPYGWFPEGVEPKSLI